jgi:hypothetical protein
MKVNEAPEKLYIFNPEKREVWFSKTSDKLVEYILTNVFIEKACEFLDGCVFDYIDLEHANVNTFLNIDNKRFIDDFRKYMEE